MLFIKRYSLLFTIISSAAFVSAVILLFFNPWFSSSPLSETFTYFPEDDQITFLEYNTEIQLLELMDENEYILDWDSYSKTDKRVYLLQDISLLFENGILIDYQNVKKQNSDSVKGNNKYHGEDNGKHEAITFHFAEVHYQNEVIKSKQAMSSDVLYIIDSPLSPIITFKEAKTSFEQRSMELLESIIHQQLIYIWEGLIEEYQINKEEYYLIPLNDITKYDKEPLPSFSMEETSAIIGRMWEGLHRYYILGINTFTDNSYEPIGNTLPLILLHKDGRHLIVLYETADQTKQQLLQLIPK